MKNLTKLLAFLLFSSFTATGQIPYIDLTFTASFKTLHVPLDSIKVSNVTQVTDTMLYAGDTVLRLEYETGIGDDLFTKSNGFYVSQNYPNPFKSETGLKVNIPGSGVLSISLSDINGRVFHNTEDNLLHGLHSYKITCGASGIFFLNLVFEGELRVIRIISESTESNAEGFDISYQGTVNKSNEGFKSMHDRKFPFTPGDVMQYFGYAGRDIAILQDEPIVSTDYEFIFSNGGFPCPGDETVEYEGQVYNTIQVGDQCWFRDNLNVGEFLSSNFTMSDNEIIEKHCYFDLPDYCDTYGGLYEWNELMDYVIEPGGKGICPEGWHVPTDEEWLEMVDLLGGDRDAGGLMKEEGTVHWDPPNAGATNQSGFTAIPGGQHESGGVFTGLGSVAIFWSSSTTGLLLSNYWELQYNSTNVVTNGFVRTRGFSVRCLRDNQ